MEGKRTDQNGRRVWTRLPFIWWNRGWTLLASLPKQGSEAQTERGHRRGLRSCEGTDPKVLDVMKFGMWIAHEPPFVANFNGWLALNPKGAPVGGRILIYGTGQQIGTWQGLLQNATP